MKNIRNFTLILFAVFQVSSAVSQTTYIWTGGTNANFSSAGNWTPVRQISRATDRLIFDNGQNITAVNVNQVTFAQLIIKNNTSLTLSPAAGNPRIIFIEGDLTSGSNPGKTEKKDLADLKYNEYNIEESTEDIATLKYNEYSIQETEKTDLATLKYKEYELPPVQGMGDLKTSSPETDEPGNRNIYIESGSTLKLLANDPSLSILLRSSATAEINGTLILEGQVQNSINSVEPYSIYFKSGSKLIQNCPGNAFNNTGAYNAVVMEGGSVMEIKNSLALNPFGVEAPGSKVLFSDNSLLKIKSNNSNILKLSGRTYADVQVSSNIESHEIIVSDCSINDLIIDQGASLTIQNLNYTENIPVLKIKGNLEINGNLVFPESPTPNLKLSFNGSENQIISGNGNASINSEIKIIEISNDITLNRDLVVNCNVNHTSGQFSCSNHSFTVNGSFNSNYMLPVCVVIQTPLQNGKTALLDDNKVHEGPVTEARYSNTSVPDEFSLSQNYPNPFNPSTTIEFGLHSAGKVNLTVYDISGKEIGILESGYLNAGYYKRTFDGANLSSGVYFYRISVEADKYKYNNVKKMILTK